MEKEEYLFYCISVTLLFSFWFYKLPLQAVSAVQTAGKLFVVLPNLEIKALYNTRKPPTGATL